LTEYLSSVVVMPKQEAVFSLITQFIDNTNTLGFIGLLTFLLVSGLNLGDSALLSRALFGTIFWEIAR
jgi:hypothetical protein